jgi:hypothetical protein
VSQKIGARKSGFLAAHFPPAQAIASGAYQLVRFETQALDYLDEYDNVTNFDIRPRRAGIYFTFCQVCFDDAVGGYRVGLRIRDAAFTVWITKEQPAIAGYLSYVSVVGAGYLRPGEILHVEAYQNSGAPINLLTGGNVTHLGGYRIF